jgi:glucokinase
MTISAQPDTTLSPLSQLQPPVGIDIGGTKINAGIVVPGERTPEKLVHSLLNAPTPTDSEAFLDTLVEMVTQLRKQQPSVSAVGIATAGVVDSLKGEVLGSTGNVPALQNLRNLKERLQARIGLPIHIENDANAAAYGEWRMGAAMGAQNMFAITLGTGVGMGMVFNRAIYRGSHFFAGEGGHIAIAHTHERKCTCGRWDCWEAFASGTGLKTTAELALEAATESVRQAFLSKYAGNGEPMTYAVIAAWKDGNHLAVDIMDAWHHHIAVGLSSLINVLDPDMVVVGGGLAQFVNFELLTERTRERALNTHFQLIPAVLGNYAGLVGAGYLALEALEAAR